MRVLTVGQSDNSPQLHAESEHRACPESTPSWQRERADLAVFISTFGLLDSGANDTLETQALKSKRRVGGSSEVISVNTTLEQKQDKHLKSLKCFLSPVGAAEPCIPVERAHVVSNLHIDDRYRPDTLDLSEWSHLQQLNLMADVLI